MIENLKSSIIFLSFLVCRHPTESEKLALTEKLNEAKESKCEVTNVTVRSHASVHVHSMC